jgi:putative ABC transport system substrate-binding protein
MRRREFIALLGVCATWPFAATAQQAGRIYRLGVLLPQPRDVPVNVAFLEEFRRYGFIEGQNLAVEWRTYGEHPDLISQYASELVEARVDVIVAGAGEAVRAVQGATKTIPIVGLASDMIWEGFVNSLSRPNGNITGVIVLSVELDNKRQEVLIEAVPGLRRLAILADAKYTKGTNVDALREAARAHYVELSIYPVTTGGEIASAIDNARASGCTALNVLAGPLFWANRQLIMDHATAMRLPAIYEFPEMAEEGGFAAYGPRLSDLCKSLAPTGRPYPAGYQGCGYPG